MGQSLKRWAHVPMSAAHITDRRRVAGTCAYRSTDRPIAMCSVDLDDLLCFPPANRRAAHGNERINTERINTEGTCEYYLPVIKATSEP